jgi:hypothetical protein
MAAKYKIRRDYDALRNSGPRDLGLIRHIVLHDIESTNKTGAAEGTGVWFEDRRVKASTNYGVDNNSIQAYFDRVLGTIPWGAPGANVDGVHIEMMGVARWDEEQWFKNAKPTMDRTAWLIARIVAKLKQYDVPIPIRRLTDEELRGNKRGITTHRQVSRVYRGTHTDPGHGFPYNWLLVRAVYYHKHPAQLGV